MAEIKVEKLSDEKFKSLGVELFLAQLLELTHYYSNREDKR